MHAHLAGLNIIGMKRSGMARADIHILRRAVKILFARSRTVRENAAILETEYADNKAVADLLSFMDFGSKRSFCTPLLSRETTGEAGDGED